MEAKNELLVVKKDGFVLTIDTNQGKIRQIHAEPEQAVGGQLGDIYIGKVRNIVKNINAAFVEYAEGCMGYLSLAQSTMIERAVHTQAVPHQEGRILIGDEIFVQITREAVKTKPPTLTTQLDLTGRYVVLTIGRPQCSISKKIQDKGQRERLGGLLQEKASDDYGWIARTNSADAPEELLRHEMEVLQTQYLELMEYGVHKTRFHCLKKAPEGYLCDIRDGYGSQVKQILTDDLELHQKMTAFLCDFQPEDLSKLKLWNPENGKLDAVYNISRTLEHALMPKVWLKSGAYLVIQPTEALVSIDVNTGKAISKKRDVEKTFLKVNREAASEIAYQLRLRNLSGMILIDFIDMKSEEDGEEILRLLREAVKSDPVQTVVVDMTKLGLVEVTRKKVRKTLYEQMKMAEVR